MKTKPFYKSFNFKGRHITICISVSTSNSGLYYNLNFGYSVKMPEDVQSNELAKTISLGRAQSNKHSLVEEIQISRVDRTILHALADSVIHDITKGKIIIKGIR